MNQEQQTRFVGRLESMRGVASLCVAVCHSFIWCFVFGQPVSIMPIWDVHDVQPIVARLVIAITDGGAWVDFFFVLSGFVLAASLAGKRFTLTLWAKFILRRAIRILPALFVALCIISTLLRMRSHFHAFHAADDGWYQIWHFATFGWSDIIQNASLRTSYMNPPSWSIRVEMLAGLVFPIFFVMSKSIPSAALFICIAAMAAINCIYPNDIAIYGYMFMLGIFGSLHGKSIVDRLARVWLPIIAFSSILMVSTSHLFSARANGFVHLASGIGSFGIVVIISTANTLAGFEWLKKDPMRFIGKISFSFYLLHYVVLYATVLILTNNSTRWMTQPLLYMTLSAVISISVCIPLAWMLYKFVERPSIALSSRIDRLLDFEKKKRDKWGSEFTERIKT